MGGRASSPVFFSVTKKTKAGSDALENAKASQTAVVKKGSSSKDSGQRETAAVLKKAIAAKKLDLAAWDRAGSIVAATAAATATSDDIDDEKSAKGQSVITRQTHFSLTLYFLRTFGAVDKLIFLILPRKWREQKKPCSFSFFFEFFHFSSD